MSIEKPVIVGIDGLHRAGKGTQAKMLQATISHGGGKGVIVRCDGTREGLGLSDGDPYSEEWQSRGRLVKSPQGNTVEQWNAASYLLMSELDGRVSDKKNPYDAFIVDRTVISRAAFLLHRGIALEGERLTLADMYPDNDQTSHAAIDLPGLVPEVIFELTAPSPHVLLDRLDAEDTKYTFRARNIRGGFSAASIARGHLPEDIERRVITINAAQDRDIIHQVICSHLAETALAPFVMDPVLSVG